MLDTTLDGGACQATGLTYAFTQFEGWLMSDYRRYFVAGGTYFFTVVTGHRKPLFGDPAAIALLGSLLRRCRMHAPYRMLAIVVLPDHLHCLWSLPPGDSDYSGRWRWIKGEFTRRWLEFNQLEPSVNGSLARERRRSIWQRRFWEHTIRDEQDLARHADYLHYNPVRHGLAQSPKDWPWSSFHDWVLKGHYPADWGRTGEPPELQNMTGEAEWK